VAPAELEGGAVYPAIARLREVSLLVAEAVARVGFGEGLASGPAPADLREHLRSAVYEPAYPSYLAG
jgi:malate dehydrogenase (oxaloacetate-decarboxylating)(NADP+)